MSEKPKLRRYQFSLLWLLGLMTVSAIVAWLLDRLDILDIYFRVI